MLVVGAQSSLTGGATPAGDIVVATELLNDIRRDGDRLRVGAGVPLQSVQDTLFRFGRWFPPVPTYLGAFAGGAVRHAPRARRRSSTAPSAGGWTPSPWCCPAATSSR